MSDAIFVLNAGSSSLKFSVYRVTHGEIEGLPRAAHFKAKDGRCQTLADVSLGGPTKSFGHAEAFAHLAHWAYEHFADELVPLAVGHRLVHGGLTFSEPRADLPGPHVAGCPHRPRRQPAWKWVHLSRGMYTIGVGDSDRRRGRDRLPHPGRRPVAGGTRPLAHTRACWRATVDTPAASYRPCPVRSETL